jgi:polar amino acid transport system ATP-binding protein
VNGSQNAVEVRGVSKWYGETKVLDEVSVAVREGEVTCLIGPSGSGKSTLLRCINGLELTDGGLLYVHGELIGYRLDGTRLHQLSERALGRQRANIGTVFQNFNLFPHLTVLDNIMHAPILVKRTPRPQAEAAAMELLSRVGLREKAQSYPAALSGGQQQRVAIARALAMRPRLMLFDEPTSALDPELVGEVLSVMQDLAESGMTMVVVTHEIGFARRVADTVAFLDKGAVVECGPVREVLDRPRQIRTQNFLAKVAHEPSHVGTNEGGGA